MLISMLAKTVERGGKDWDERLPFVLFAYRASEQHSTCESPFFLLYGRHPRLPTDAALCPLKARATVDLREYGAELVSKMAEAWDLAQKCIGRAQNRQKTYYDKRSRPHSFTVGDRVFLFKPAEKTGEARKLSCPYHGPYRVVQLDTNTAHIRRVDRPQNDTILVALNRLRRCPLEIGAEFWPPDKKAAKGASRKPKSKAPAPTGGAAQASLPIPSPVPAGQSDPPIPEREDQSSGGVAEQPADLTLRPPAVDQSRPGPQVTSLEVMPPSLRQPLSHSVGDEADGVESSEVKGAMSQGRRKELKWDGRLRSHRRQSPVEDD